MNDVLSSARSSMVVKYKSSRNQVELKFRCLKDTRSIFFKMEETHEAYHYDTTRTESD